MKLKEVGAPAKLTLVRLALIPMFMLFLVYYFGMENEGKYTWPRIIAASLFILACVVYAIDKRMMRSRDVTMGFWGFLDVVADRLVILSALLSICFSYYVLPDKGFYKNFFFWSTAVIVIRELVVIGICLTEGVTSLECLFDENAKSHKNLLWITTALQMLCVATVILEPILFKPKVFWEFRLLSLIVTALTVAVTVASCLYGIIAYKKYVTEKISEQEPSDGELSDIWEK